MFSQLLRLLKHSSTYLLAVIGSQAIGVFLLPIYTRYLTPADYGVLSIITTTQGILLPILGMGIGSALLRSFSEHSTTEGRKEVISTTLIFLAATSACFVLMLILAAKIFSSTLFHSSQYTYYFQVMFLSLFFDTLVAVSMSVFQARQESKKYMIVSLFTLLVGTGLNIYLVVGLSKGVLGILQADLLTGIIFCVVLLPLIIRGIRPNFSLSLLKEMLGFGLPLVPVAFFAWIIAASDRYFLQIFSTSTELGLYSLGYKFGGVLQGLILGPFQLAWMPFLFSISKEKNAKQVYSSVLTYFILVAMFVALALSVLSKEVLILVTTPAFYNAYKVIPLIALSYVFYGSFSCLDAGLYLQNKTRYIPFIVGAGAFLNLGLNYLLIPSHGMMGAAIATAISYLLLVIIVFLVSMRFYPINYEWSRIVKVFLAAGLVYAGSLFIISDSMITRGLLKVLILLAFPLLLFVFGFFKAEEISKTKEILRLAPGYVRTRLARNALFHRRR